MHTQFAPPAVALELDWCHEQQPLLETLIEATKPYESMSYRVVNERGPGGGWPIVRFVADPDELDAFVVAYCDGDIEQAREYLGDDALR